MAVKKLDTIAKEIQGALKTSIQDRIKIGKLLNEARVILKEDQKFGDWRSENFSDQIDQKTGHNYMRLAECFADKLPDNIPLSGLYKLSEKQNNDYRDAALSILAHQDKVLCMDVEEAIATIKYYHDDRETHLTNIVELVGVMPEKDSCEVFMALVNNIGKEKVQGWLDMDNLDQEAG